MNKLELFVCANGGLVVVSTRSATDQNFDSKPIVYTNIQRLSL